MESKFVSGDLILLSKVEGHAAAIITNGAGGPAVLIGVETSRVINTRSDIKMYKVLVGGKISHVTKDRIIKVLSRP